jgi:anti-anti-sigma factor
MDGEFNLQTEKLENTFLIKTEGYINNTAGEKIAQFFAENPIKNAIFDLEKSKVINSIGISYLLEVIEQINDREGKIIFLNLDPSIEKTFKIMGLFQFSQMADSLDSAMKELA